MSFNILNRTKAIGFFALGLLLVTSACSPVGYNQGYIPEQPIPYSHALHAGQYKIPCQYCHVATETSRHATVPAGNVCVNCHMTVATDRPNIKKLLEAYGKGEPIKWVRVHMLPDHVMFNHKRHVKKGVACQTCHGPIETMDVVQQKASLTMGWCVNCHKKPENKAPTNCSTCHY